jgi:DNA-binding response OmpR family regulator
MNPKLLIVDDELEIREILKEFLADFFTIESVQNGKEAVELTNSWKPDLILMDLMMPEMDGMTACKIIREQDHTRHIPILMLTAANATAYRMNAFSFGADDFISKPFDFEELKIRLFSKLKRVQEFQNVMSDQMSLGNHHLDDRKREITIAGKSIDFSPVEYGIVKLLMNCVDQVVSREKIMKAVWKDESKNDRLIDAHMTSVRKKIAQFDGDFQTIYGEGYRLKNEKTTA